MNTDNSNKKINIDSKKLIISIGSIAGLLVIILIIKTFFLGNKSNDKTVNTLFTLKKVSSTLFKKIQWCFYNSFEKQFCLEIVGWSRVQYYHIDFLLKRILSYFIFFDIFIIYYQSSKIYKYKVFNIKYKLLTINW